MTDNRKEREAFESALSKNSDVRFWNTTDAMFWAWSAALAQAQSCVPAAPELCDPSCGTYDLASMILSDCGHSSNNQRLLDRVAARIDKRLAAVLAASPQPQPVQPSDTQWQKRHPLRTEGVWENTNEHDAKWWRDPSQGWEIRVLYAHQVTQAKPEQAAQPMTRDQLFEFWGKCDAIPGDSIFPEFEVYAKELIAEFCRSNGITLAAPQPKD